VRLPLLAHRDLASRIHVRNAPESGQTRTDVNVESPGGISPPGAPKTVREPLDSHGSRCSTVGTQAAGFTSSTGSSCCHYASVGPWPRLNNAAPSVQPHYRAFIPTRATPPLCSASVLSSSRFWPLETSPFTSERQVLTFRTRARLSFAPPTCRMPLGQPSGQLPNLSRESGQPPVSTSSNPISTLHRRFAFARLSQPHPLGLVPTLAATLTTIAFNDSSLQWFEARP